MTDPTDRTEHTGPAGRTGHTDHTGPAGPLPDAEDFWLELGPPAAYYGTDAYQRAKREGDASPDGERLGYTGAEPGARREKT
ncbi:MAG TPA: hypothetical protein H9771_06055 [Candidatus Faecalibacterium faecipullorum]|uniref:Uncharacterized protein n=1 Tax=Candidatus Faecalibacterium faecipullorum TaxID=2838578 RepID=A0A9D2S782_9FIRM|nr:hypothetical protein [uncultured Oscillibacter sp.]HJB59202.1 hypothetical protein [Candidatus Faecalibacterium faecipullorum]